MPTMIPVTASQKPLATTSRRTQVIDVVIS
jgi:hypothetical protein